LYETIAIISGLTYLSRYAAVIYPEIFIVLQSFAGGDSKIKENINEFRSLFTIVAPIGFVHLFGAFNRFTSLIDLTIVWRLLWGGPWLYINAKTSGLERSAAIVMAVIDVGIPLLAIILNFSTAVGIPSRLLEHFSKQPISLSRTVLLWIGRVGFAIVLFLSVNVAKSKDQLYLQSFYTSVPGLYFLFYNYISHSPAVFVVYFSVFIELVLIANLLVLMYVYGEYQQVALQILLAYTSVATFTHLSLLATSKTPKRSSK